MHLLLFDRTLKNCKFYEQENKTLQLLNEIGVLRGIAYCLEEEGVSVDNDSDFIHFIEVQNELLVKGTYHKKGRKKAEKMDKIVKRYNKLMYSIGREHVTICTKDTEEPESTNNWNLRDMVSEVQYWLETWQSDDSVYREAAYDTSLPDHKEVYNQYRNDISRMERFIARFENEALTMKCTEQHCSRYD